MSPRACRSPSSQWRRRTASSRRSLVSKLHPLSVCAYTDDPLFQLAASDRYVRTMAPIDERTTRFDRRTAAIDPKRRLCIGYVSSDLRHHAVDYLMVHFFEEHDGNDFEAFTYYAGIKADDPIQTRIQAMSINGAISAA